MEKISIRQRISNTGIFSEPIKLFWTERTKSAVNQDKNINKQQGARGQVLSGKHMDGFYIFFRDLLVESGVPSDDIYFGQKKGVLPGYFRSEKDWDFIIVNKNDPKKPQLVAALELKSQVGSVGRNINNRVEEALGNSVDLWTAYKYEKFNLRKPWVGYFLVLEDSVESYNPVKNSEPYFPVFPEFENLSYCDRYKEFCKRVMRESFYTASCFILARKENKDANPNYLEPDEDLNGKNFMLSFLSHLQQFYNINLD